MVIKIQKVIIKIDIDIANKLKSKMTVGQSYSDVLRKELNL